MANYKGRRLSDRWIKERLAYYADVPDEQVLTQAQAAAARGMTQQCFVNERWDGYGPTPIVINVVRSLNASKAQNIYLYTMAEIRRFERARLHWADCFNPTTKDFRPLPMGEFLPMVAKPGAVDPEEGTDA